LRFFAGLVTKKETATMSSPSSMVAQMWRRRWQQAICIFLGDFMV
jgi:hypothetical protein